MTGQGNLSLVMRRLVANAQQTRQSTIEKLLNCHWPAVFIDDRAHQHGARNTALHHTPSLIIRFTHACHPWCPDKWPFNPVPWPGACGACQVASGSLTSTNTALTANQSNTKHCNIHLLRLRMLSLPLINAHLHASKLKGHEEWRRKRMNECAGWLVGFHWQTFYCRRTRVACVWCRQAGEVPVFTSHDLLIP